jgi:hypothetical protein
MKNRKPKVGDVVAFNDFSDPVWWEILEIKGFVMTIKEQNTNYAPQKIDTCYIKQYQ